MEEQAGLDEKRDPKHKLGSKIAMRPINIRKARSRRWKLELSLAKLVKALPAIHRARGHRIEKRGKGMRSKA